MLCSSVILKKYKKIQKLNKREKDVMFLHFPSLPCIAWLVSSLVMPYDDLPAQLGNVGRAAPSLPFLGMARWCRAASRAGASGLGLRVPGRPYQTGPWDAVPGGEGSRRAVNRHELGLPRGEEGCGGCWQLGGVGKNEVPSPEASVCLPLVRIITF